MKLKLKEILWEVTLKCNKNCAFCGSKKFLNDGKELSDEDIDHIVEKICEYPPEELTFSGGEPLFGLGKEMFLRLVHRFSNAGIKVKVLTNGYLIKEIAPGGYSQLCGIVAVGWSLNSAIEVKEALKIVKENTGNDFFRKTCVPITNFGIHNIFDFDKMYQQLLLDSPFRIWQVQLTEGNDFQLNSAGISYLKKKIQKVNSSTISLRIVEADNLLPDTQCEAGITSCSITRDGLVIPCLSSRSWCSFPVEELSEGSLLDKSLKEIWECGFKKQRFGDCPCCKNYLDYPLQSEFEIPTEDIDIWKSPIKSDPPNTVAYYSVIIPYIPEYKPSIIEKESVFVYGVYTPDNIKPKIIKYPYSNPNTHVIVYAVVNPNSWSIETNISTDPTDLKPKK